GRGGAAVAAAAGAADAAVLAARAALRLDGSLAGDGAPAQPLYLRAPDVTPPKPRSPL
ncbi:tRNA (adenosine(37)-N6)-threonylcarbamoyltransferase complex dimerization subunit type 1 TsaB, partial [Pelagibius litoralis]|nr:tRNA (adenosine(37)-N6)-threonylcarbamoyltransferase complex dimerization subunit type 1 TsaB [Pelagibius litoralis]